MQLNSQLKAEKRPVRVDSGRGTLDKQMTKAQAQAYGDRHIPADLKKAGFLAGVFESTMEINGSLFYRVCYGMTVRTK